MTDPDTGGRRRGAVLLLQNAAARVASGGGKMVFHFLVASTAGPAGKGVIAVLEVLLNTLYSVVHLSLSRAALPFLTGADSRQRDAVLRLLVRLQAGISVLAMFAGALGLWFWPGLRQELPLLALALFLVCLPYKAMFESYLFLLPTLGCPGGANLLHAARGLLLLMLWGAAWWLWGSLTVNGIAVLYAVSFILLWLLATGLLPRPAAGGRAAAPAGELLRNGGKIHLGYLAAYCLLFVDQLMLKQFRGLTEVGYYSLAVNIFTGLMILGEGVQFVVMSRSRELAHDADRLRRATGRAMLLAVGGSVLLALVAGLAAPPLLARFLPAFLPSVEPLLWLLPGLPCIVIPMVSEAFMLLTHRVKVIALAPFVALLVNIGLNFWLIPARGAVGAAAASTASYAVWAVILLVVGWRTRVRA